MSCDDCHQARIDHANGTEEIRKLTAEVDRMKAVNASNASKRFAAEEQLAEKDRELEQLKARAERYEASAHSSFQRVVLLERVMREVAAELSAAKLPIWLTETLAQRLLDAANGEQSPQEGRPSGGSTPSAAGQPQPERGEAGGAQTAQTAAVAGSLGQGPQLGRMQAWSASVDSSAVKDWSPSSGSSAAERCAGNSDVNEVVGSSPTPSFTEAKLLALDFILGFIAEELKAHASLQCGDHDHLTHAFADRLERVRKLTKANR